MSGVLPIEDRFNFVSSNDQSALNSVLGSGTLSGKAAVVGEYENALASLFQSNHCVAVSSGTAALHAALHAVGVAPGTEVIVPAAAPLPTVMPILTFGATPVFVDVAQGSFDIDLANLGTLITDRTKAILLVHLWGYPTDVRPVVDLARQANVPVIEDAAQAHFSKIGSAYAGTLGQIGCFSTHDRKILATGEGGFLLTNEKHYEERLRNYITVGNWSGSVYGVNLKLGALLAAIGLARIPAAASSVEVRNRNAALVTAALADTDWLQELPIGSALVPNHYSLVLRGLGNANRFRVFRTELLADGIPCEVARYDVKPIYQKPIFLEWARHCPNTEELMRCITALPTHPGLREDQLQYMADRIAHLLARP